MDQIRLRDGRPQRKEPLGTKSQLLGRKCSAARQWKIDAFGLNFSLQPLAYFGQRGAGSEFASANQLGRSLEIIVFKAGDVGFMTRSAACFQMPLFIS